MRKFTLFLAAICCCAMMNAETYGLSVGGVQVTSDNAADIFGDGTVSYDASLAELTLNNADIRVDYNEINKGAIVAAGDLTIVVKGQNNYIAVNNLNAYTGAIQSMGARTKDMMSPDETGERARKARRGKGETKKAPRGTLFLGAVSGQPSGF